MVLIAGGRGWSRRLVVTGFAGSCNSRVNKGRQNSSRDGGVAEGSRLVHAEDTRRREARGVRFAETRGLLLANRDEFTAEDLRAGDGRGYCAAEGLAGDWSARRSEDGGGGDDEMMVMVCGAPRWSQLGDRRRRERSEVGITTIGDISSPPPEYEPGVPTEMPPRPNIPEIGPIPLAMPADPPPLSPGPNSGSEFPSPPDLIPPEPEAPRPHVPSPPEIVPPDVTSPKSPEPGPPYPDEPPPIMGSDGLAIY
ncbi:actin cytoskeleton-regulatory complex protein PAN1 [Striga asiatica]|uniref:Actin cytoskeleton-regulatory complex protein PAN1 n=1 Tax=Striga asiatica TaxID=4170 RepID=A0A5A7QE71_STRAF|nr:actin cytoskeleton-regulatory complex protein PAN1 [Striga asiatica]